ncbi:MAG TPA: hypothetical protein PKH31_02645, partial [Candidatus Sumerlaeota bacterium]|nr:hypothetical protein [Candidatus Sumerlaeota bacterium]
MQKQQGNLAFLKMLRTCLFLGLALCVGMAAQAQDWNFRNIGVTAAPEMGSITFTPDGTGATLVSPPNGDIWGGTDKFTFGYKVVTGDGSIIARLDSSNAAYTWSKTGVTIRQSLAANSPMVDCMWRPGDGGRAIQQSWINSATSNDEATNVLCPVMLKIEKVGAQISSYYSLDDGDSWTQVGPALTLTLTDPFYVGIAGCANTGPGPYTSTFSKMGSTFDAAPFTPIPLVTPTAQYMGFFPPTAGTPPVQKVFQVKTTEPGSQLNITALTPSGTGYSVAEIKKNNVVATLPVSVAYNDVLDIAVAFAPPATEGYYPGAIAVTANVAIADLAMSATVMGTYDQEWKSRNVGVLKKADEGSVTFTEDGTGAKLVSPASGDIWNGTDIGVFGYKTMTGDGSIVARLDRANASANWSKAGVTVRQSMATNAQMAACEWTPGAGVAFQTWTTAAGSANTAVVAFPATLRLDRVGNVFTAYYSKDDGATWTQVGDPQTIVMKDPVYVGLAGCSNGAGTYTADFSNIAPTFDAVPSMPISAVSTVNPNFGLVTAGSGVIERTVTVVNSEPGTTLNVSDVTVPTAGFSIASIKKNGVVVTLPTQLIGGTDTLEVTYSFNPTTDGVFVGSSNIVSDCNLNPTRTIALGVTVGAASSCPVTEGMVLHLDASSKAIGLDSSNRVQFWGDLSGNGQYVQRQGNANGDGRPAYVAGTPGVMNGKSCVRFDGTDDWMWTNPLLSAWPREEITVFFVAQNSASKNCYLFSFDSTTDSNRCSLQFPWDGGTADPNYFWDFGNDGGNGRLSGKYSTWGDPLVQPFIGTVQSSTKTPGQWAYWNGKLVGSDANADPFEAVTQGRFGLAGTNGGDVWPGDLYEMIIFNKSLSAGELNEVGYYLQQKYAVAETTYKAPTATFSMTPNALDYRYVEPAQGKVTREVVVKNDGSPRMPMQVSLSTSNMGAAYTIESVVRSEDPQPVSTNGYQTTLAGDQTLTIKVSFDPTKTAPTGTETVKITHNANGAAETADLYLFGRPGKPAMPPVTDGLYLYAAVDNITMARDGWPVWNWTDYSGNGHDAVLKAGSPTYVANGLNGKPVIRFNGTDAAYYRFTTCEDTRTVFVVLKEDADASGDQLMAPIIGNQGPSGELGATTPDFCRGENKAIFNTNTNSDPFAGD